MNKHVICYRCGLVLDVSKRNLKYLYHTYIENNIEHFEILSYTHCRVCGKDHFVDAINTNLTEDQFNKQYDGRILYRS